MDKVSQLVDKISELVDKIGEVVLTEAVERAETLLEVLNSQGNFPKERIIEFLTMDVADVLAMIAEVGGKQPGEVYSALASIEGKEERARTAVATLAKVLVESIRKEQ